MVVTLYNFKARKYICKYTHSPIPIISYPFIHPRLLSRPKNVIQPPRPSPIPLLATRHSTRDPAPMATKKSNQQMDPPRRSPPTLRSTNTSKRRFPLYPDTHAVRCMPRRTRRSITRPGCFMRLDQFRIAGSMFFVGCAGC
jgi:hypothetical protein